MFQFLDMRTVLLMTGMIMVCMLGPMFYIRQCRKTYDGFDAWMVAVFLFGIGSLMLGFRGALPDLISIVVANLLVVIGFILITRGLNTFYSAVNTDIIDIVIILIFGAALYYLTFISPDLFLRIIVISGVVVIYVFRGIITSSRSSLLSGEDKNWLVLTALSSVIVFMGIRCIATIYFKPGNQDFLGMGLVQSGSAVVFCISGVVLVVGLITLNLQRLEQEFKSVSKDLSDLLGLIPICANCKSIRDDQGSWSELEAYFRKHVGASFTHSICPECCLKLYPDLDQAKLR